MNPLENNKQYEIIDNENTKINEKLDNKEELVAIGILKNIDVQIKGYDIDLAYDKNSKEYYFISNNKDSLKIPFNLQNLMKAGNILIELFNTEIQLQGDLYGRTIAKDTWMPNGLEEKIITDKKINFTKNDIEELFVFVMKTKGIAMKDWKVESTVCKGGVNNECKQALGK